MGNKIITEKDFWMCTGGAVPAQLQTTQLSTKKISGHKYITVADKATSSWIDFGCKKLMLIMAILAAVVVVAVVATGGAALAVIVAAGAAAGAAGAAFGAVIGSLICGQKAAAAREWLDSKNDLIIQGQKAITGDDKMICHLFGETISFAPNIKNWWQAIGIGALNYLTGIVEGGLVGALIGVGGSLLSGATSLAMPTLSSIGGNLLASFGAVGTPIRALFGADKVANEWAMGDVNSWSEAAKSFGDGAVPEAGSAYRIATGQAKPSDAMLLLYLLHLKAPQVPKEESPANRESSSSQEEANNKSKDEETPQARTTGDTEASGRQGEFEAFEDPAPITPSKYGLRTIAEDPVLHRLWEQSMKDAMNTGKENAFTRYVDKIGRGETPTQKELEAAFAKVRDGFLPKARQEGYTIDEVHHWNYGKTRYPNQVVDPRNLVPVPDRATHTQIHQETSSGTNYFKDPISPQHVLPIDESHMPLAPPPNE